ncbi:MAG: hypothetical protein WKF43_03725 [Acidimicrobiales bacterium]
MTWSARGADQSTADEAQRLSNEVHRRVKAQLDPRQKLHAALDPRPLLNG